MSAGFRIDGDKQIKNTSLVIQKRLINTYHNIFLQLNYNKIPIIIIKYIFKFNLSFCYNRTTQNNSKKERAQFKRQDKKNNNII